MKMKKILAILLSLVLALSSVSLFAVSASAAEGDVTINVSSNLPDLFPDKTMTVDGDAEQVTVTYWFNVQDYDMVNAQFSLSYDNDVLIYDDTEGVNWEYTTGTNTRTLIIRSALEFAGSTEINLDANTDDPTKTVIKGNCTRADSYYTGDLGKTPFISVTFLLNPDRSSDEADVTLNLDVLQVRSMDERDLPAGTYPSTPIYFVQAGEIVENTPVIYESDETYAAAYEGEFDEHYGEDIPDANLNPAGMFLTLLSNVQVTFVVPKAQCADYSDIYAVASIDGRDEEWEIEPYDYYNTYWAFDFTGVYASSLTKTMHITVYGTKNGVEHYSEDYTRTVEEYCLTQLAKDQYVNANPNTLNAYMRSLFVDLLNYGAAVQVYGNYNTDNLANRSLTATQQAYSVSDISDIVDDRNYHAVAADEPTLEFYGYAIAFKNSIEVMPHFRPNNMTGNTAANYNQLPADGYVTVEYNGNTKIYTYDEIEKTAVKSGVYGDYSVTINLLMANQLDRKVRITAYDAEGNALSDTFEFTVNNWLGKKIADNTAAGTLEAYMQGNEYKAVSAMAKYGKSAYLVGTKS